MTTKRNTRRGGLEPEKLSYTEPETVQPVESKVNPVAASSPRNENSLDSEDDVVIEKARQNVEDLKREVTRHMNLIKFKVGAECLKLPFDKALFAKIAYDCFKEGITEKSEQTLPGYNSLSFANMASSTGNRSGHVGKNTTYDKKNLSRRQLNSKAPTFKEVTFREDTFDIPRNKSLRINCSGYQSKRNGESSNNIASKRGSKKGGARAVAFVTPGPEVNRPLSVLRKPIAGELALSLFGSPLLVAPDCAPTVLPQINLPTADGKVVAILPRDGFTVDDMPLIATPTRHQLKTLNKYLNDLCHQHQKL